MPEQDHYLSHAAPDVSSAVEPPPVLEELAHAAGIDFNGNAAWDIQVHNPEFFRRVLSQGSLGFGESFMDELWDAEALDELFFRLLSADVGARLAGLAKLRVGLEVVRHSMFNLQSSSRAYQVAQEHYDIGNDVFEAMLDPTMSYSCAYWERASNLEEAQQHKLDMICRKLQLQPGETLLDIGCGWGGLAKYAAEHYGVDVVGVTVSKEQQKLAQERCKGLPVTIELKDYRELSGLYDKIVSVGMFEHVGPKNYPTYFDTARRLLKTEGLFLLHTIGSARTKPATDPWLDKYIFPNGKLPSARDMTTALEGRFILEDWHNFGQDYDRTLMAWWERFDAAWPQLEPRYGRRFYRMWKYYLMCCAGYFRARRGQLWQLVLTRQERELTYRSVR